MEDSPVQRERIQHPAVSEGPMYSQAIRSGDTLYLSGQVSLDADGNLVGEGDAAAQVRQVYDRIKLLCEAAGGSIDGTLKLTVYLKDISDFATVRAIRGEYFSGPDYPASTLIANIELARPEFLVEIEAIVAL